MSSVKEEPRPPARPTEAEPLQSTAGGGELEEGELEEGEILE